MQCTLHFLMQVLIFQDIVIHKSDETIKVGLHNLYAIKFRSNGTYLKQRKNFKSMEQAQVPASILNPFDSTMHMLFHLHAMHLHS